jgi:hypothetical protein
MSAKFKKEQIPEQQTARPRNDRFSVNMEWTSFSNHGASLRKEN